MRALISRRESFPSSGTSAIKVAVVVLVYVGAVMVLFLFVVMMLDINLSEC